MAKKDFDKEFAQIEAQYLEMMQDLKDMEKEMAEGLINPDIYEQMKNTVDIIISNYRVWDYIRFILNKPVKKNSRRKYEKSNSQNLSSMKTLEQTKLENQKALNELKEYK